MATLTAAQIGEYARKAGFSGAEVPTAVAIALAESGGNPRAHNATPPDDSYGLWQINMLGKLGPDRRKRFGLSSNAALYDPATNAVVAHGIYKGSGWSAWTTYTRGTYKKHLTGSTSGPADVPATSATGDAPTNVEQVNFWNVAGAINALGKNLFTGLANVAGIAVAIALVIVGLVILSRNALPVGKVAKIAKKVVS